MRLADGQRSKVVGTGEKYLEVPVKETMQDTRRSLKSQVNYYKQ